MNADQKQRAVEYIADWKTDDWDCAGEQMADLLQEIVDAPEAEPFAVIHLDGSFVHVEFKQPIAGTGKFEVYADPPVQSVPEAEPFGYFKSEPFGWTDCAETDDGAIALYTAPPAPSVPELLTATNPAQISSLAEPQPPKLSDERIFDLLKQVDPHAVRLPLGFKQFARAIEREILGGGHE